jgi:predicted metal-dependent RNase
MVIVAMGYKRYFSITVTISELQTKIDLPVFALTPDKPGALQEVVVTAKKPLMEQAIDKTIINVDAMISAATAVHWKYWKKHLALPLAAVAK